MTQTAPTTSPPPNQHDPNTSTFSNPAHGTQPPPPLPGKVISDPTPVSISPSKESEPIRTPTESVPTIIEVDKQRELGELEPDLATYVKPQPKETLSLDKSITHQGQSIVKPTQPVTPPQIVLPMTKQSFLTNLGGPVNKSASWLAKFCQKLIHKFKGSTIYSSD